MVNNFDVCYYDDMAIHFDIFAGNVARNCSTSNRCLYRYAYLHCEALVFDSNTCDVAG